MPLVARKALPLPRKPRSDCPLENLTGPARQFLDRWLFTEHLGYRAVCARLSREFGVKTSKSSLARYFKRASERAALCAEHAVSPDDVARVGLMLAREIPQPELFIEHLKEKDQPAYRVLLKIFVSRKVHRACRLDSLPAEQRARLDQLLFVENLGQRDIARRMQSEFGLRISHSALSAYYQRRTIAPAVANVPATRLDELHRYFLRQGISSA